MQDNPVRIPQMLLIGSTGRNSGKTTFAAAGIARWKRDIPIIGLKITSVDRCDGSCPRGGVGCGACSSLQSNFDLSEETDATGKKDTSLLLAAGCQKVYWLRALKSHMEEAIRHFLSFVSPDTLIVCESNSLRGVAEPGIFVMLHNTSGSVKESAGGVMDRADLVIKRGLGEGFEDIFEAIEVSLSGGQASVAIKAGAALV